MRDFIYSQASAILRILGCWQSFSIGNAIRRSSETRFLFRKMVKSASRSLIVDSGIRHRRIKPIMLSTTDSRNASNSLGLKSTCPLSIWIGVPFSLTEYFGCLIEFKSSYKNINKISVHLETFYANLTIYHELIHIMLIRTWFSLYSSNLLHNLQKI